MAEEYEWLDSYNIGIDSIDKEHKQLFSIINKLLVMQEDGKNSEWICNEGIKFFRDHATTHFANEEAYMAAVNYKGIEHHKQLHKGFREITLPALEKELERTNYSKEALNHFLGVCAGWLIGHTLTDDLAIAGKNDSARWQNLFTGEEQEDIKKVVTQQMFNFFRVEAHLISERYGAEKFGNGVYYRLVYGTKSSEKKLEIVLVFEEKLIINTMGKILGIRTNTLDDMILHAARYSARQFVASAMKCFPDLSEYALEREDFLSYKDFYNVMKNGKQQLSLLFDTEVGYFAYCVIAPHLLETGIGSASISISSECASANVKEYLNRRKEKAEEKKKDIRKKILLVDDSAVARETINKLLSTDYAVTTVDSGVSAIRTIALNPPDLVLLDYEMPICDGRQTLEMLRSDEVFASVPVIFLTGRNDPNSIIGVMPLKPAGYILKNSKPDDIKKQVDEYFAKEKK